MRWNKIGSYRSYLRRLMQADVPLFDRWAEKNEVDLWTFDKPNDLVRYLQSQKPSRRFDWILPPYTDHARLFRSTKTGNVWFVSQPYDRAHEIREEVTAWAEERDLHADVYDTEHSWYYPGETCLIVIRGGEECKR